LRKIEISSLRPGMILSSGIYNSRGEELIMAGKQLTDAYVQQLLKQGVTVAWVDDAAPLGQQVNDVIKWQTRLAAVNQVRNILLDAKDSGRLVIEPQNLYNTVGEFTEQLLARKNLIFNLVDLRSQDDYTFAHSVNVCTLSLMTGITMGYSREDLEVLGVGALLHDLGKVKIPDQILNKPGALSKEEFDIMKKHTIFGYELIHEAGNIGEVQALMALQHHENYDGSGYPVGIQDKKIHEFSQVVAIADRFDAITADRVYRKAFPPHEAFEMCSAAGNYFVKDNISKAFMHNIAAYPAGTLVELNNGMIGMAVDTPKGFSLFPLVRVFYNSEFQPVPKQFNLPLYKKPGLCVLRVLQDSMGYKFKELR